LAMAKYRALYASIVNEIAGNSNAGILKVSCMFYMWVNTLLSKHETKKNQNSYNYENDNFIAK